MLTPIVPGPVFALVLNVSPAGMPAEVLSYTICRETRRTGTMQGALAIVADNYTMEIAVTATGGSQRFYWSYDGTPTWH
jgi:hypothetical protein